MTYPEGWAFWAQARDYVMLGREEQIFNLVICTVDMEGDNGTIRTPHLIIILGHA